MKKDEILKILEGVKKDVRQRYKAEIKGIFGSYARGEEKQGSDVDVLVEFLDGATLFDLAGLGDFLEEKLRCKVDIVSQKAIRKEIEPYIYGDLVRI